MTTPGAGHVEITDAPTTHEQSLELEDEALPVIAAVLGRATVDGIVAAARELAEARDFEGHDLDGCFVAVVRLDPDFAELMGLVGVAIETHAAHASAVLADEPHPADFTD